MNRRYNNLTGNQFAPNGFPTQQPMPSNMTYHPNNMHQMPPPHPLQRQQPSRDFRQRQSPRRSSRQSPYNQPPQGHMTFQEQNFNGAMPQEKKGILSKLFRNSNKRQPAPTAQSLFSLPPNSTRGAGAAAGQAAATTAASGGVLQSLVNPANITTMLNNTQRVLQAAESIGPLVQQYGPLVKNFPSMWKLFQGLKTTDTDEQNNTNQNEPIKESITPLKSTIAESAKPATNPIHKEVHIKPLSHEPSKPSRQYAKGESIPKLFF